MSAVLAAGAALAAGSACGADASTPAATIAKARLHLTDTAPPTVHGTGFRRHERVTVTFTSPASGQRVRHPRTSDTGAFSVVFRRARLGRCGGYTARAVDASGRMAVLHPLQPRCIVE
jgi:hypothetical protein